MTSTFHGSSQDIKINEGCEMRENVKIKKICKYFTADDIRPGPYKDRDPREKKTETGIHDAIEASGKKLLMSFHLLVIESFLRNPRHPQNDFTRIFHINSYSGAFNIK